MTRYAKWVMVFLAVTLVGCQTTTRETTSAATKDGAVQRTKYEPKEAAEKRLSLGLQYLQAGHMEWAKHNLLKAYEHAPDMPDVLYGLAYYYQTVYEYDKAEDYYQKAIDESPRNADYLNAYGVFLCDSRKKYDDGIRYFLKAVEQPNYTSVGAAYENAGFCAIRAEKFEPAKQYFEKALSYNPNLSRSLYGMAEVNYVTGNHRLAEAYLYRFEAKTKPTAKSLLLGYKIAKSLDARGNMRGYGDKLMELYPTSDEAQEYISIR
ncbi:type IV pilus biogenesis/stability protein PilW [Kangiella sp.]|uniref:type IV pilus biogenesis/stability protein PilW n=1 Tax=Kangiella sp. TaxID=1920245 RepID=UPI00198722A0|nr:type IV pilus biogenesis/stability protein PilW [Kangiella sp.]MBD3654036.1 type IV pilus biogenesis/stability protein PilW [Kangiella sp.]